MPEITATLKEWLGHKNLEITQRYAKLFPGELERARDVLQSGDAGGDAVTRQGDAE